MKNNKISIAKEASTNCTKKKFFFSINPLKVELIKNEKVLLI